MPQKSPDRLAAVIYFFNIVAVCHECHKNMALTLLLFAHCTAWMNNLFQTEKIGELLSTLT